MTAAAMDVADAPADPAREWALLAPQICSSERLVRLSYDRGATYPSRLEQPLDVERPRVPAAVRLYDTQGMARCLALDFDVKRGGRRQVHADVARVVALLAGCGGVPLVDQSVSGGRHVYLLLRTPRHLEEIRPLVTVLRRQLPTLDPSPTLNATVGCLRPPGSRHPRGGSQRLVTPWPVAVREAATRAPDTVWQQLLTRIPDLGGGSAVDPPGGQPSAGPAPQVGVGGREIVPAGEGPDRYGQVERALAAAPAHLRRVAVDGVFDVERYPTRSEARFALLSSLNARGCTWTAVLAAAENGALPGLLALSRTNWKAHLADEWDRAVKKPPVNRRQETAVNCNTRGLTPHGGAITPRIFQDQQVGGRRGDAQEYQFVRSWWTCVELVIPDLTGRSAPALIAVLTALGAAAQKSGSRVVAFGTRSLEQGAGCDHSTVSRALLFLSAQEDPLIDLLEKGQGPAGDCYSLRIPDRLAEVARTRRWRPGRIEQVHPVFRVLGLTAWVVHAAITRAHQNRQPPTLADITTATGLSRSAAAAALAVLDDHGLVVRDARSYRPGPRTLHTAARLCGALEVLAEIRARHQAERCQWRAFLAGTKVLATVATVDDIINYLDDVAPEDPLWREEPPPEPARTPLQLIQDVLGGYLIE